MEPSEILFPYSTIRPIQKEMLDDVGKSIEKGKRVLMHAPTGIGKTISVLGPALFYALKKNKTVVFLTSRHTQHVVAMDTLKDIKKNLENSSSRTKKLKEFFSYNQKKNGKEFVVADIIGKKWMCGVQGIDKFPAHEFREFCKLQREEGKCEFYSNTIEKRNLTVKAKKIVNELGFMYPSHSEELVKECVSEKLCPYEIALALCSKAKVIVADYFYLFNSSIRTTFLNKIGKELEDLIVIVDEGHNLPDRVRDLLTLKLSNFTMNRAIKEARENGFKEARELLQKINEVLVGFAEGLDFGGEILVNKVDFVQKIGEIKEYYLLIEQLDTIGDDIRKEKRQSYIGAVASFLDGWLGLDLGYARILSKKQYKTAPLITLSYRCLDPSLVTSDVFEEVYSLIIMSGTLTPTSLYKDVLGFPENSVEKIYGNPFPEKNRLNLIVPKTTTKYSARSEEQFKEIGRIGAEIVNNIPGNSIIFFPSYGLMHSVYHYFNELCDRKIIVEKKGANKEEKKELLEQFKKHKEKGMVFLGITAGSFGEGIDLPGDLLKGVIVVGIPLQPPDLETKELIKYYDERFDKGWDYGYVLPAITKVLQNAGRCIRSEKDKGIIVFLDERYAWNHYLRCFPDDWDVKVSKEYVDKVKNFFG